MAKRTSQVAWVGVVMVLAACGSGGGGGPGPDVPDVRRDVLVGGDPGGSDPERDDSARERVVTDLGSPEDVAEFEEPGDGGADLDACVPQCEGRECGDDGCGGICGYCPYGFLCKVGVCVEYCVPDCTGRACGDDGCGGLCGECEENEFCGEDFTCVLKGCEPACSGHACGPDGCGGSCGSCGEGQVCDPQTWQCVKDTACHEVTAEGRCVGSLLQWCEAGVLQEKVCDPAEGLVCGFSVVAKKYDCLPPEQCEPQCSGKECGPDQCGATCGECAAGRVCSTGGTCGAPCGDITETGSCQGDVLQFCHQGILITYDCAAHGLRCQWDPTGNSGKGWFDCL